jgi:hypothetical protein
VFIFRQKLTKGKFPRKRLRISLGAGRENIGVPSVEGVGECQKSREIARFE